jgi:hypothetical protein
MHVCRALGVAASDAELAVPQPAAGGRVHQWRPLPRAGRHRSQAPHARRQPRAGTRVRRRRGRPADARLRALTAARELCGRGGVCGHHGRRRGRRRREGGRRAQDEAEERGCRVRRHVRARRRGREGPRAPVRRFEGRVSYGWHTASGRQRVAADGHPSPYQRTPAVLP